MTNEIVEYVKKHETEDVNARTLIGRVITAKRKNKPLDAVNKEIYDYAVKYSGEDNALKTLTKIYMDKKNFE